MELLAPAGSKAAFMAAIKGGADSIYVGIQGFNARAYAKNLSRRDLAVLLDFAHEKGRKVYVAFNTLIKHQEMEEAAAALASLEKLGPDALIVQDMGVARIAREYFPGLKLHASTQMAVHNREGAAVLSERGFERVILARELSFSELKRVASRSPVELEVFCHGALCFCVSGMCLFSSAIGGHSGNRGRCTQPCRRIWKSGGEKGYVFSPRDLQLAEQLPKLRSLGIAALKIEGRMRSSDYVYRVVRAYRTLLDAPEGDFDSALGEAQKLLAADYAREKSPGLFAGRDPALFDPRKEQVLGVRIGVVEGAEEGRLKVRVSRPLENGDRLRVADSRSDQSAAFKVREFSGGGGLYSVAYTGPAFRRGAGVFLAGDAWSRERGFLKELEAVFREREGEPIPEPALPGQARFQRLLANRWKRLRKEQRREQLWVRVDDPAWLDLLGEDVVPVLSLNADNLKGFLRSGSPVLAKPRRVLAELTPYIAPRETAVFREAAAELASRGLSRWVLNNPGQFALFKEPPEELVAGPFLYAWNAYAAAAWQELGVRRFVFSWEDDMLNLRELCRLALRGSLAVYLYGCPPLARSRFLSREMSGGGLLEEKPGTRFRRVYESGSGVVLAESPFSIFTAREKLSSLGIDTFGIDLSHLSPERRTWETLLEHYRRGANPAGTFKFNFKRGVK